MRGSRDEKINFFILKRVCGSRFYPYTVPLKSFVTNERAQSLRYRALVVSYPTSSRIVTNLLSIVSNQQVDRWIRFNPLERSVYLSFARRRLAMGLVW